jgi:hypothetical protein
MRVLVLLVLTAWYPQAQAASPWRFWTKSDGLRQTVVFGLTVNSSGQVLIKSSDAAVDLLDGYIASDLVSTPAYGRLLISPDDKAVWSFSATGIKVHDASGMHDYPDSEIAAFTKSTPIFRTSSVAYSYYRGPEDRIDVAPFGTDSGIIMFPDRIIEWNRATGRKRVIRLAAQSSLSRFRDLQQSRDGGLWISGERGLAYLRPSGADVQWTEFQAPPHLTDLVNPMEGEGREVFISTLRRDGKRVLARFAGGVWNEVFVGSGSQLKGWRGAGTLWVQDDRKIIELGGTPLHDLGGGRDITGLTTATVTQPGGAFWLGTTEGAARYSPPLWRTPAELNWVDTPVSAIAGDSRGRLWFLNREYLVVMTAKNGAAFDCRLVAAQPC